MFLWRLFISSCNSNAFCLSIEGKKRCRKTLQLHIISTETTSIRMESPDVERNCRWKSNRRHVIRKHWLHSMHSTLSAWNMHTYNVFKSAGLCQVIPCGDSGSAACLPENILFYYAFNLILFTLAARHHVSVAPWNSRHCHNLHRFRQGCEMRPLRRVVVGGCWPIGGKSSLSVFLDWLRFFCHLFPLLDFVLLF